MASSTTRRAFWTTSSPLSGRLDGLLLRFGIAQAWHESAWAVKRGEFQIDPLPEIGLMVYTILQHFWEVTHAEGDHPCIFLMSD